VIREFSVSIQLQEASGPLWWFTGVYGPHQDNLKQAFLQELSEVRAGCDGPWILAGDFNQISRSEDKNNSCINRALLRRFRRWIDEKELKEISLIGRRYTWSNQRQAPTLVKLDHVFCTSSWEGLFPASTLFSKASEDSDHCPLILKLREEEGTGKRRFHFESFWTKMPGFRELVADSWSQPLQICGHLERISLKLKRLTRALQSWGHKTVGNIKIQLGLAREILHRLEMAQDSRVLSPDELWLLRKLKQQCLVLASLERTVSRLRSRVQYLKDGDANTSFFHMQACCRWKRNHIYSLLDGERVVTSHDQK
jgi:hypothetical protein